MCMAAQYLSPAGTGTLETTQLGFELGSPHFPEMGEHRPGTLSGWGQSLVSLKLGSVGPGPTFSPAFIPGRRLQSPPRPPGSGAPGAAVAAEAERGSLGPSRETLCCHGQASLGVHLGPPESEEERTGVVGTLLLRPPLLHPTSQPRSAMNRGTPRGSIARWFQEPQLCPASPGLEPCSVRGSRVTWAPVPLHSAFQFPRLHSAGYSPSGSLKSGRWQLSD